MIPDELYDLKERNAQLRAENEKLRVALAVAKARIARERSLVYFVQRSDRCIKVGTTTNLVGRMRGLKAMYGPLDLLASIPGGKELEQRVHRLFSEERFDGEWFWPSPAVLRVVLKASLSPTPDIAAITKA